MKHLVVFVLVSFFLVISVSAQAQIKPVVYAGGGVVLPISPEVFKDYWKISFNAGGGVGIQINPNLEITGNFYFNTFPFDGDKLLEEMGAPSGVSIDGLDFQALEISADIKYLFSVGEEGSPFKPYVVAGVGLTNAKFTDATITGDGQSITLPMAEISESKVAFGGGLGFAYMFTPMAGLWMEGRYAVVATSGESTSYIPVRVGLKLLFGE